MKTPDARNIRIALISTIYGAVGGVVVGVVVGVVSCIHSQET
jgi:uncharacterized membrane protein